MTGKLKFGLALLPGLLLMACGGNRGHIGTESASLREAHALVVPAGVDSATAITADSLAGKLFVSYAKEEKADSLKKVGSQLVEESDSLWKYLTMKVGEKQVMHEDTLASRKAYNQGAISLNEIIKLRKKMPKDSAAISRALLREATLLDRAQASFETAIRYNPFDNDAKSFLAYIYKLQAVRLGKEKNYDRVARILERLTRIIRGEHALYARLGETYFAMKQWDKSMRAFENAENVLLETADLNTDQGPGGKAKIDSTAWFQYVYYQGYDATNLHLANRALEKLRQALTLTRDENLRKNVQSVIDWINWDNGNIATSEERDRIIELESQGKFAEAEKAYAALIPRLVTQQARDE
ncbi:MAG: hypothetical protein D6814_06890, partial [Calditrichaeota bacterium]